VRHGLTQYNLDKRMQGWRDIPLTAVGRAQARAVAARLQSEPIDAIYTSDHRRAALTARYIARLHNLPLHTRRALRERRMGIFEGWRWEDQANRALQELWEQREAELVSGNYDWKAEGEESMNEHFARTARTLDHFEHLHPTGTLVLVSHGAIINRMLEYYRVKDRTDTYISLGNTAVTVLVSPSGMVETPCL
jgi:probable phosphoglycerate mutase